MRAAGYDPLTRPRREGTTYVVRATNYRGILMRIVVDARSGAIRAVNRIVPGPAPYGVVGMMAPPPPLWRWALRSADRPAAGSSAALCGGALRSIDRSAAALSAALL